MKFVFYGIAISVVDNKVRGLATVCLPWQHWTKALVWFDDVDKQSTKFTIWKY